MFLSHMRGSDNLLTCSLETKLLCPLERQTAIRNVCVVRTSDSIFYFHLPRGTKCQSQAAALHNFGLGLFMLKVQPSPCEQIRAAALFVPWGNENFTKIFILMFSSTQTSSNTAVWHLMNTNYRLVSREHLANYRFLNPR